MKNDPSTSTYSGGSQFGFLKLFYVASLITVGLILSPGTIVVSICVLVFWACFRQLEGSKKWLFMLLAAMVAWGLLLPSVITPRHVTRLSQCRNNVRQLMLSIIEYEEKSGQFPPAYAVDINGKPIHSWRVLILPEMGYQKLYDSYDFDQPWDSPNNSKLIGLMPSEFQCPSNRESRDRTPYKLVVDKGTAFEQGRLINFGDISDGSSNTIGVIEDSQNPVIWTKPEGLTLQQATEALAPKDPSNLSHVYRGTYETTFLGSCIALMDSSAYLVGPVLDPEMIKGACLCNDGQAFDFENSGSSIVITHLDKYIVAAVYLFLLILPAFFSANKLSEEKT